LALIAKISIKLQTIQRTLHYFSVYVKYYV